MLLADIILSPWCCWWWWCYDLRCTLQLYFGREALNTESNPSGCPSIYLLPLHVRKEWACGEHFHPIFSLCFSAHIHNSCNFNARKVNPFAPSLLLLPTKLFLPTVTPSMAALRSYCNAEYIQVFYHHAPPICSSSFWAMEALLYLRHVTYDWLNINFDLLVTPPAK